MGYAQAGFDVTVIDIIKKRDYPFNQIKADCLEIVKDLDFLRTFDLIHASPPCQANTITGNLAIAQGRNKSKVCHITPIRAALVASGVPYVIENVAGAPLLDPLILCGSMFGLKVKRHRLFESNLPLSLKLLKCNHKVNNWNIGHKGKPKPIGIYGTMNDRIPSGGWTATSIEEAREAMGIDWLNWRDLTQALPPAYTKFLGSQVMGLIQ
jgi:DNA (cytosine-5)-methyltransferase 1